MAPRPRSAAQRSAPYSCELVVPESPQSDDPASTVALPQPVAEGRGPSVRCADGRRLRGRDDGRAATSPLRWRLAVGATVGGGARSTWNVHQTGTHTD
jgi:hypothetical protein